jgi:hypothetical protein
MEEVESNEPSASKLDEVASLDDGETQELSATIDNLGKIQISRKRAKGRLPGNPEELRMKLRIEGNVWLFLASKFTNRAWLQNLTPQLFSRYADHFLGRKVHEMLVPQVQGEPLPLRPPWSVVLNYEYSVRKRAFEMVREEGLSLGVALVTCTHDSELKEINFTSPISLMGRRGVASLPHPEGHPAKAARTDRQKGAGNSGKGGKSNKDGGKGSGKQSSGKGTGKLVANTADGRQICFAFNSATGCAGSCGRVHVCRKKGCLGPHPLPLCDKP